MNHASPINPHHLTVSTDHIIVGACLPVEAAVATLNVNLSVQALIILSAVKPAKVRKECSVPSYAVWATVRRSSRHANLQFDNHHHPQWGISIASAQTCHFQENCLENVAK